MYMLMKKNGYFVCLENDTYRTERVIADDIMATVT
jgi:hypothetical protein